jgi:hypothetical protein
VACLELKGHWLGLGGVGVEVEGDICSIATLASANVDCDEALEVGVELKVQIVSEGVCSFELDLVRSTYNLDGLLLDAGLVLDGVHLLLLIASLLPLSLVTSAGLQVIDIVTLRLA